MHNQSLVEDQAKPQAMLHAGFTPVIKDMQIRANQHSLKSEPGFSKLYENPYSSLDSSISSNESS